LRQSVTTLADFYASRRGRAVLAMTLRRLHALWPHLEGRDILGYGYALPFLKTYEKNAARIIHAMPQGMGAQAHETPRGNCSVMTTGRQLPFMPGAFDRVLVMHGLEEAANMAALLKELWRVMAPEGRVVIVAANRAGLWARSDKTPFGAGRPFSGAQLSKALTLAGFETLARAGALYCPPFNRLCGARSAGVFEKFGETVWPGFSGLVLVEAIKRHYVGTDSREKKRILQPNFKGALGASQAASTGQGPKEAAKING